MNTRKTEVFAQQVQSRGRPMSFWVVAGTARDWRFFSEYNIPLALGFGAQLFVLSEEENKNSGFNREMFNDLMEHIKSTLSEKTIIIKRLKASLAVSAKAFNDTIRVYEAKLIEFGLPPEELGFQLLETNTSKIWFCFLV